MYRPLYLYRFGAQNEVTRAQPWSKKIEEPNYYSEGSCQARKSITINDCSEEQANEIRKLLTEENPASFSFVDTLKKLTQKGSSNKSANSQFTKEDLDSFVTNLDNSNAKIVLMVKLLKSIPGNIEHKFDCLLKLGC